MTKLADKRVGIIGTGATAVQCVPHLAKAAGQVFVFQRTPSSVDVRDNSPTDRAWFETIATPGWQQRWLENFTENQAGGGATEDLVQDGWTDLSRRIRARIAALPADDRTPQAMWAAAHMACGVRSSAGSAAIRARIRRDKSVQPSWTRSSVAPPPAWFSVKFSSHRCCQPGVAMVSNHARSVGELSRTSTEEGVRWKTKTCPAAFARWGTHCTAVAPVPIMPTRLSASLVIGAPSGVPPV